MLDTLLIVLCKLAKFQKTNQFLLNFSSKSFSALKTTVSLNSKRGANGGYLLAKSKDDISIGMILDIIDGPFDPIGVDSGNHLSAGLEKCFGQMIEIVNAHLNHFTIRDILEIEEPKDLLF